MIWWQRAQCVYIAPFLCLVLSYEKMVRYYTLAFFLLCEPLYVNTFKIVNCMEIIVDKNKETSVRSFYSTDIECWFGVESGVICLMFCILYVVLIVVCVSGFGMGHPVSVGCRKLRALGSDKSKLSALWRNPFTDASTGPRAEKACNIILHNNICPQCNGI